MRCRSEVLTRVAVEHLRYLPCIVRAFKDWRPFLRDYLLLQGGAAYTLRNGLQIETSGPQDVATLAVVFAKEEYGSIPEDAVIVDLGANIGAFSLYATASTERSVVYAYEPEPHNFDLLRRNIRRNGMTGRIRPSKYAVAGREETRPLYLSESPFHSLYPAHPAQRSIEVPCLGLADVLARHRLEGIDLLKIDCEGAEFEILYGTPPETLRRVGEVRMEVNVNDSPGQSFAELQGFMEAHDFELLFPPTKAAVAWFRNAHREPQETHPLGPWQESSVVSIPPQEFAAERSEG